MLVNSFSGVRGMWDLFTNFRPQSSFSFFVHVVFLSQPVRYRTRLLYSAHYQVFTNVTSINLLV